MEWSAEESKYNLFDVYYTTDTHGATKKLVVVEGLNPNNEIVRPQLEQSILAHYDIVSFLYWMLLAVVFAIVIGRHIVMPLYKK